MKKKICIDIGGTTIKYGIINSMLAFEMMDEIPTNAKEDGGPGIIEKVISIVERFQKEYNVNGIAVSSAGMVDCEEGKITFASPLIPNYTGTELKKILETKFQLPCEVENDVNCAGLAEYFAGAAQGTQISLCLTIGTGIGGSIIMNQKVFHGYSGSGCEVGYMHLPGGEFQDLGASSILVRRAAKYKGIEESKMNGKTVFENAINGDADCIRAIEEMIDILGMGIANICYVLNPEIVVLGGGIMAQKEYLYARIRRSIDHYLMPNIAKNTKLAFAQNQNRAGMLGAYFHFRERHQDLCD